MVIKKTSRKIKHKKYYIVRTYSAGVFAGNIVSKKYKDGFFHVVMENARRIWYWDGAASLSQMAIEGVSKPENCKFAMPISTELPNVIEINECTAAAEKNIKDVFIWKR